MRTVIRGLSKYDAPILRGLEESGYALPPAVLDYNLQSRHDIEISYSTINRRLKKLSEAGLVEKEYDEGGYYGITELGKRYLENDLSKDEADQIEADLD